jgi:hypothetical protein
VMLLLWAPLPVFAKTVFLVCDGQFETSTAMNGPVETEQFDGSLYLSVEADDFAVRGSSCCHSNAARVWRPLN